jgi:hypothetical protein
LVNRLHPLLQEDVEWKVDVVNQIFMPHNAEEVLKIILPKTDSKYFISWQFEKMVSFQSEVLTD